MHDGLSVLINGIHLLVNFLLLVFSALLVHLHLLLVNQKLLLLLGGELLEELLLLGRVHFFKSLHKLHRLLL